MDKTSATQIINRFNSLRLLVVGDLMIDEYVWGSVSRISPEAPIPIVEVTKEEAKPGGAANVGLNLLAMGARVLFAGVVGDDANGRRLVDQIRALGGDTSAVITDSSRPTTIKSRVIAHQQQIVRIDREKTGIVTPEVETRLFSSVESLLPSVDGIVLSDYAKGVLSKGLVEKIVRCSAGKIIAVDPKPQNVGIFADTTVITPNKREAEQAVGFPLRADADVEAAARALQSRLGVRMVLITRGDEGMTLLADETFLHLPTKAKQVFDVTGAGDTVIGVLTLALCAGATPTLAADLSNLAAGITVAHIGVYAVKPDELIAAL